MKKSRMLIVVLVVLVATVVLAACNGDPVVPPSYTIAKEAFEALFTEETMDVLVGSAEIYSVNLYTNELALYRKVECDDDTSFTETYSRTNDGTSTVSSRYWYSKENDIIYQYSWKPEYEDLIVKDQSAYFNNTPIKYDFASSLAETVLTILRIYEDDLEQLYEELVYDETAHQYSWEYEWSHDSTDADGNVHRSGTAYEGVVVFENNMPASFVFECTRIMDEERIPLEKYIFNFKHGQVNPPVLKNITTVPENVWNELYYSYSVSDYTIGNLESKSNYVFTTPTYTINKNGGIVRFDYADGKKVYWDCMGGYSITDVNGEYSASATGYYTTGEIGRLYIGEMIPRSIPYGDMVYNNSEKCYVYERGADDWYKIYLLNGSIQKIEYCITSRGEKKEGAYTVGIAPNVQMPSTIYTVNDTAWNDIRNYSSNPGKLTVYTYENGKTYKYIDSVYDGQELYCEQFDNSGELISKSWIGRDFVDYIIYTQNSGDEFILRESMDSSVFWDYQNSDAVPATYFKQIKDLGLLTTGRFSTATFNSADNSYKIKLETRYDTEFVGEGYLVVHFENAILLDASVYMVYDGKEHLTISYTWGEVDDVVCPTDEEASPYKVNEEMWDSILQKDNLLNNSFTHKIGEVEHCKYYKYVFSNSVMDELFMIVQGDDTYYHDLLNNKKYASPDGEFSIELGESEGKQALIVDIHEWISQALVGKFDNATYNESTYTYQITVDNVTFEIIFNNSHIKSIRYTKNDVTETLTFEERNSIGIPPVKTEYMVSKQTFAQEISRDTMTSLAAFTFSYYHIDKGEFIVRTNGDLACVTQGTSSVYYDFINQKKMVYEIDELIEEIEIEMTLKQFIEQDATLAILFELLSGCDAHDFYYRDHTWDDVPYYDGYSRFEGVDGFNNINMQIYFYNDKVTKIEFARDDYVENEGWVDIEKGCLEVGEVEIFIPSTTPVIPSVDATNKFSVIGSMTYWQTDIIMEQVDNMAVPPAVAYVATVDMQEGDEFKIRYNGNWDLNFGTDGTVAEPGVEIVCVQGGDNFIVTETRTYQIIFMYLPETGEGIVYVM